MFIMNLSYFVFYLNFFSIFFFFYNLTIPPVVLLRNCSKLDAWEMTVLNDCGLYESKKEKQKTVTFAYFVFF